MEITAKLRHLHLSPRKVRLVANMVKGMEGAEAERELEHRTRRAAGPLLKLMRSAMANARHNFQLSGRRLTVKSIRVDPGPTATRYRPRAFGRTAPLRRRTSHVTLILEAEGEAAVLGVKPEAPTIRKVELGDLGGEEGGKRPDREIPEKGRGPRPKSPGFIRRIFQRKAI